MFHRVAIPSLDLSPEPAEKAKAIDVSTKVGYSKGTTLEDASFFKGIFFSIEQAVEAVEAGKKYTIPEV